VAIHEEMEREEIKGSENAPELRSKTTKTSNIWKNFFFLSI
jgi:hypothetical protein